MKLCKNGLTFGFDLWWDLIIDKYPSFDTCFMFRMVLVRDSHFEFF